MPLPKKYREKYDVKLNGSEVVAFFMFKILGLVGVFLFFALGVDVYRFIL